MFPDACTCMFQSVAELTVSLQSLQNQNILKDYRMQKQEDQHICFKLLLLPSCDAFTYWRGSLSPAECGPFWSKTLHGGDGLSSHGMNWGARRICRSWLPYPGRNGKHSFPPTLVEKLLRADWCDLLL